MNKLTATLAATASAGLILGTGIAAHADTIPACKAAQLHYKLSDERATTGQTTWTLTATDEGPACTLDGFGVTGLENARHGELYASVTRQGHARPVLVLYKLSATAKVTYGSDGDIDAVPASYVTVGRAAVRVPGGPAWIYGGQVQVTAWTLPK
jgi:hypothetical protein